MPVIEEQKQDLMIQARDAVKKSARAITGIKTRKRDKFAQSMTSVMLDMYDYGRQSVREERAKALGLELADEDFISGGDSEFIKVRAELIAASFSDRLQNKVRLLSLELFKTFDGNIEAFDAAIDDAIKKYLAIELERTSTIATAEAFNIGRVSEAKLHPDEIDHCEWSALLDDKVCKICEDHDVKWRNVKLEELVNYEQPPLHNGCRCMWIFVFKSELKAVA